MKKVLFFLAAIFPLACTQIQIPSDSNLPTEIDFSVQMGSFATKATDTAFEEGDQMNLAVIWQGEDETPRAIDVRKATYKNEKITLDNPLYWPKEPGWEEANFVMVYPYMPGFTQENIWDFINGEVFFTVKADQSTHALYTSSDLIAGGCYELQETDAPCTVKMTLAHTLSQVRIVITNKSEFKIKDVYLSDVYGTYEMNWGKLSGSKGMIKTCNSGNDQWTCIVPPQTGKPVIHITTTDNREIVFKAPSEIELPQSVRTNLLLTLNDNAEASDFSYEIVNWDPGQDFNFNQNDWESLGTGQICDYYFGDDFFPVEIERNKENPHSFRVVNPYSGIKQAYYPTSSAVSDEYLYFRIFDKGEVFEGQTVTRDNFVYFEQCRTGYHYHDEIFDANFIIMHPSEDYFPIYRWNTNKVVWFQDNGLPGQVGLSPIYELDDFSGYAEELNYVQIDILFPDCSLRTYSGGIVLSDDIGYGSGIKKENGKTYLSFRVEKRAANVNSLKFTVLDGRGYYYSDLFDLEDGLIDSQTVTGEGKDILYEIPDNYAYHCILMETYGDGYPQNWYAYSRHDTSMDNSDWIACGKGTYYSGLLGTQSELILFNSKTDDLKHKIEPWYGSDCLPFAFDNDYDNTLKIEQGHFTGYGYGDMPLYVSDYSSVNPSAESSYFQGRDAFYYGEGIGTFNFNPYYYTSQGPVLYGNFETFQLTGSETSTKASHVLKSAARKKQGERVNIENFPDEGAKAHRHRAPETKVSSGASTGTIAVYNNQKKRREEWTR